jgi:undecaprenyl-phosphate 4-deoxy-4-formamido-L-arabinose transferase
MEYDVAKMEGVSETLIQVSIVIPAFNAEKTLEVLIDQVSSVAESSGWAYEIVVVDDASSDETWKLVSEVCATHPNSVGIRMARNSGQQASTLVGLRATRGETIVTMDDDFQHRPEDLPKLVSHCTSSGGDFEVVNAIVVERRTSIGRRFLSRLARLYLRGFLGVEGAEKLSSFRAIDRRVIERLDGFRGSNISIDAMLRWVTSGVGYIETSSGPQQASRYSIRALLKFAVLTSIGYSKRPLFISLFVGLSLFILTSCSLVAVLIIAVTSGQPPPGYIGIQLAILSFAAVQLLFLGTLSVYFASVFDILLGRNQLPIATVLTSPKSQTSKERTVSIT